MHCREPGLARPCKDGIDWGLVDKGNEIRMIFGDYGIAVENHKHKDRKMIQVQQKTEG